MSKRILIATGGTGGHIYPAVAIAQQLTADLPDSKILFVGGGLEKNKYFGSHTFDKCTVSCATLLTKSPVAIVKTCASIAKGVWQSRAIIRDFKPHVAVGFGSYYSFPPLVAARMQSVPLVLHEANSIPGKVNKLLAPLADAVGVHFPQTIDFLKGQGIEVGMPLRAGYKKGSIRKEAALKHFGLESELPTLLVFGGSQGARIINVNVLSALKLLKQKMGLQVINITGDPLSQEEFQKAYESAGIKACVKAYENRMDIAWQAADAVVCRAGASTVAELFEFEVPGILIPFVRAAEGHQEYNADFIVKIVGGSKMLHERDLTPATLAVAISDYFEYNGALLAKMRKAMGEYKIIVRKHDLLSVIKQIINR